MLCNVSTMVKWEGLRGRKKEAKEITFLLDFKQVKIQEARCKKEKDSSDLFCRIWVLFGLSFITSSSLFWFKFGNATRD